MKIRVKDGVILKEANPWLLVTLQKVMEVGQEMAYIPTITSLNDGKHMSTSYHYQNLAVDLRTRDLSPEEQKEFLRRLKESLGSSYDVILEKDHIHVETK